MSGLTLIGRYVGEEISKPITTKKGEIFQTKTIAIQTEALQNTLVEVPMDYKVKADKDGNVSLAVKTSAKTWDDSTKRFQFVNVKFYIPKP